MRQMGDLASRHTDILQRCVAEFLQGSRHAVAPQAQVQSVQEKNAPHPNPIAVDNPICMSLVLLAFSRSGTMRWAHVNDRVYSRGNVAR
ncbi:protein of unknown function [Rhodovastum atsumiense]|nr:protein of unknown function [Rhodovastum atsumiense]